MEILYSYQIRKPGDKRNWEDMETVQKSSADRVTAILYGRRLARVFNAEIRMTDGADHKKSSATYLKDEV